MIKLQILGTGCPKCKTLTANAEQAAKEIGIEYEIEKVQDINDIVSFGVMSTPALAVDGKVLASGKVLAPDEIQNLLKEN